MAVSISGDGAVTGVASINTDVSSTELGYLDGVTSAIQPQIAGAGGLVLVDSYSFSGASSVSRDNIFSATHNDYVVIVSLSASADNAIRFRMRASGTDLTSSAYMFGGYYVGQTGSQAAASFNNLTGTEYTILDASSTYRSTSVNTVCGPYASTNTSIHTHASGRIMSLRSCIVTNATAYDGLTLFPQSGTLSGTITTYGYAQ